MIKTSMFCLLWILANPLQAQHLQILTEEDPPYSFIAKDGKPSGFGVEVVTEIQNRVGNKDPIEVFPWARAYHTIIHKPHVVVFTMTRTAEREDLFQWVGPIIENRWVFIGRKGSGVKITNLEAAKNLAAIGVVNGYAWERFLTDLKFKNLERVVTHSTNVKMLKSGRINAFVSSDLSYAHVIAAAGFKPEDFEILYSFNLVQMYIAHSKTTNREIIQRWQSAFDGMKQDGTLQRILAKWALVPPSPQ